MTPFLLHVKHSFLVWAAPVVGFLGLLIAWSNARPMLASNGDVVASAMAATALIAPLFSGLAAWDGLRELRHHGATLVGTAARPRSRIILWQVLAGACFATLVFAIIVGGLYLRAAFLVLSDDFLPLSLALILVLLLLSSVIGYLTASLLRHWLSVLVAPVPMLILYGASMFRQQNELIAGLIPFGVRTGTDFLDPNQWFFGAQLLVALGILVGMIAMLGSLAQQDWLRAGTTLVVAVGLCVGGILGMQKQQGVWGLPVADIESRLQDFTSEDGALTLRLLPYYAPIADDLLTGFTRTQRLLAETPLAFDELSYTSDAHPVQVVSRLTQVYPSDDVQQTVMFTLQDGIPSDCFENNVVMMWLAGGAEPGRFDAGWSERVSALNALEDAAGAAWLREHFDGIQSCALTAESFPGR